MTEIVLGCTWASTALTVPLHLPKFAQELLRRETPEWQSGSLLKNQRRLEKRIAELEAERAARGGSPM